MARQSRERGGRGRGGQIPRPPAILRQDPPLSARETFLAREARRRRLKAALFGLAIYAGLGGTLVLGSGLLLPGQPLPAGPLWLDLGAPEGSQTAANPPRGPRPEEAPRSTAFPSATSNDEGIKEQGRPAPRDAETEPTPGDPTAEKEKQASSASPLTGAMSDTLAGGEPSTSSNAPPPGGEGGAEPALGATAANELLKGLTAFVESHKTYPEAARRRGTEGRVGLAFVVDAAGHLLSLRVAGSSGSALLDAAARELLASAFPLPGGTGRVLELSLSIRYSLARP